MMKGVFSSRQLICLFLVLVLTVSLCGCGRKAEPTATEPAATEPAATEPAATEPAPADSPAEPAAEDAAADGFFLTAEYDRLYYAPLDGSAPRLAVDNSTTRIARGSDGWAYAAFEDGSVRRVSSDGSRVEELLPAGGHAYRKLIPFEEGFIGVYYSLREGAGFDLCRSGSLTPKPLFDDDPMLASWAVGRYLYAQHYGGDLGGKLTAYDQQTLEPVWEIPVDNSLELVSDGSGILGFIPNKGLIYRLDEDAQAMVPLDLPLAETDCELTVSSDGVCLVQGNYSDDFRYYLVDKDGRRSMEGVLPEYFTLIDVLDGKALLNYITSRESAADADKWVRLDHYMVLDLKTGEVSDFPVKGQYGALFSDGDFPVMDSSTARKPVTADIYAFFCESTGAGGTVPLCSTTHNAWLNIADRVADVALLAAPTDEEQAYLEERGVSVEMKLYGGDGLVFIGNRACGVEDLSLEQVRAIYRGEITNWAQLGGADHVIRVLYRDDQSGSQRLFERMMWKDEPVPDFEALGFDRLDDMSSIVSECLYDPYAIGYSIMTYLNDVFDEEQLLAFSLEGSAATPENVAARNYPLGTQGFVVIRSDEPENSPARRLFDWFGSPLSDVILTNNGVTPLHENG